VKTGLINRYRVFIFLNFNRYSYMSKLAIQLINEAYDKRSTFLDLGNCGLKEIPKEILKLKDFLEELNFGGLYSINDDYFVSNNNLDANSIAEFSLLLLKEFPKLTTLQLESCGINGIGAKYISQLSTLRSLDLVGNKIGENGAKYISRLSSLTSLDLYANYIGDLGAKYISNLSGLTTLNLGRNEIGDQGIEYITRLSNLTSLEFGGNEIGARGVEYISRLSALTSLELGDTEIGDQGIKYISQLTSLNWLGLYKSKIGNKGAEYISQLSALTSLSLGVNEIGDEGAEYISRLSRLISLGLGGNKIGDQGCEFLLRLPFLNHLRLENNKIKKITATVSNALKTLNLRNNQIESLSLELIKSTELEIDFNESRSYGIGKIFLHGNPIKNIPHEVLGKGRKAILEYLEGDLRPLNECKLIFVGDGSVGKTSLMKRLVNDQFDEHEGTTHGINKIAWKEIKNEQGEPIKVNCWDFGGQHIQHSLHQFFFTERVIYVLVLNPRNDEKAGYWLDQIDKLGSDSQIIIVFNWKDEKDICAEYLRNFRELKKTYKYLPEPIVLSCKTGEGISDFKAALKNAVLQNEGLKTKYPVPWFNIKEKLETRIPIEKHYIKYDQYEAWCAEEAYNDPEQRRNLLRILDSVGSIVFFDKPVLNELQVLNPEWISTGAYAILTADITRQKKGHVKWEDLRTIFSTEKEIFSDKNIRIKYDEPQFEFILQLMLDYWLCQENPLVRHEYLIPVAFGEKPDKMYDVDGGRHYRLKFSSPFEMLIIHRFIAKNILNIVSDDYWNSGIYFKHASSSTYALVDTNQYSQVIDCWIKGDNIRGMWEVIRNDFREIFNMYHNFPVDEEVAYIDKDQTVFLKYDEMLRALINGVAIIPYDTRTGLKDIDVLRILELFESPVPSSKIMEKEQIKVEVNPQITINPQFTNNPVITNTQTVTEPEIKQPTIPAKGYDLHAENQKVKQWKYKALISFAFSAVITGLLVVIWIKKWLLGANAWKALEKYDVVKWIGLVLGLIWNGFIVKSLYDRFLDPSKEKAYREALRK
jgi:internalin A